MCASKSDYFRLTFKNLLWLFKQFQRNVEDDWLWNKLFYWGITQTKLTSKYISELLTYRRSEPYWIRLPDYRLTPNASLTVKVLAREVLQTLLNYLWSESNWFKVTLWILTPSNRSPFRLLNYCRHRSSRIAKLSRQLLVGRVTKHLLNLFIKLVTWPPKQYKYGAASAAHHFGPSVQGCTSPCISVQLAGSSSLV